MHPNVLACRAVTPSPVFDLRARWLRVLLLAGVVSLAASACNAVAGHGSLDPATAYFGPGGRAIPVTTTPPGVAVTSAQAAVPVLAKSFPGAATGVSDADLAAVRTVVLQVVARLHADPAWLCGTASGADPVEAAFPTGAHWADDPKKDPYRHYEALYQLPGCDQVRFLATYIGDQSFRVTRDGDTILVAHSGTFTYDTRSLSNGVHLPVHAAVRRTFGLRHFTEGWRIVQMVNARTFAAPGAGPRLPRYGGTVPGIQAANQLSAADPAAARQLRQALARTIGAGSASISFTDRSSAVWRGDAPDQRKGTMWPSAGSAQYDYPTQRTSNRHRLREFVVDKVGDYTQYSAADAAGHTYTEWDARVVPEVADLPVDSNPYVPLAMLNQLDAAGGTRCDSGDRAETCYVARIPVQHLAIAESLTTRVGFAYASYGVTEVAVKVGVADGRIAFVSQDLVLPVVGHPVVEVHWRLDFGGYQEHATAPELAAPPRSAVAGGN